MCPACISSIALVVTGAISTGTASAFVVRMFPRTTGSRSQPPESKETIRHDYKTL
jgi:hypothetical protein